MFICHLDKVRSLKV